MLIETNFKRHQTHQIARDVKLFSFSHFISILMFIRFLFRLIYSNNFSEQFHKLNWRRRKKTWWNFLLIEFIQIQNSDPINYGPIIKSWKFIWNFTLKNGCISIECAHKNWRKKKIIRNKNVGEWSILRVKYCIFFKWHDKISDRCYMGALWPWVAKIFWNWDSDKSKYECRNIVSNVILTTM